MAETVPMVVARSPPAHGHQGVGHALTTAVMA